MHQNKGDVNALLTNRIAPAAGYVDLFKRNTRNEKKHP